MSLLLVSASDSEHELRRAFPGHLGRHFLAQLVRVLAHVIERDIGIDVVASRHQSHQHACRARCRHDRRERELGDQRIVELRERVGQCIEHLSTELQVLVMASATTFLMFHVAPRHGSAVPDEIQRFGEQSRAVAATRSRRGGVKGAT